MFTTGFTANFNLLEEVKSLSYIPGSTIGRDLSATQFEEIINLVEAGIYLAAWLAIVVKDEMRQFDNFVRWIRFGDAHDHY